VAHYSRAPITEALIDLRVTPTAEVDVAALESIHSQEAERYPEKKKLFAFTAELRTGDEVSANATQLERGWALISVDKRQVFQAQVDGFTFSRLTPYETWESFRQEAFRLWQIYRAVNPRGAVTRIAVRYLNRLDLPLPLRDFKDYLHTVPEIGQDLPQSLSGFFMQLHIPIPDVFGTAIVTETLIPPSSPEVASVVLDINLARDHELPTDDADIWKLFEDLHNYKNKVFEGCITDLTREMIK
jgi:uncharacterized protein (TIGR04255 family)